MWKSEKFSSKKDDLSVSVKGVAKGKFVLYYHTDNGDKTALYTDILNGEFELNYRFDPVSLNVYKKAEYFSAELIGDGTVTKWLVYTPKKNLLKSNVYSALNKNGTAIVKTLDGKTVYAPVVPNKALFMGNSILLGMSMKYGMCSTKPENDYASIISSVIRSKNPNCSFERIYSSPFEHSVSVTDFENWFYNDISLFANKTVKDALTIDIDLIILQIMDNVNTFEKVEAFKINAPELIKQIKTHCPNARIVWLYGWFYKSEIAPVILDICSEWKIETIDVSSLHTIENEAKSGQISLDENGKPYVVNDGWITHPGDSGMKEIANAVLKKLFN